MITRASPFDRSVEAIVTWLVPNKTAASTTILASGKQRIHDVGPAPVVPFVRGAMIVGQPSLHHAVNHGSYGEP